VFGFDQIVEAHKIMEEGLAAGKMTVAVPGAGGLKSAHPSGGLGARSLGSPA
jgi:hypothetical protein